MYIAKTAFMVEWLGHSLITNRTDMRCSDDCGFEPDGNFGLTVTVPDNRRRRVGFTGYSLVSGLFSHINMGAAQYGELNGTFKYSHTCYGVIINHWIVRYINECIIIIMCNNVVKMCIFFSRRKYLLTNRY